MAKKLPAELVTPEDDLYDGSISLERVLRIMLTKVPRAIVVAVILLSCIGCDQAAKLIVKEHLRSTPVLVFAGDMLRLQYAENAGAFLGMGSSWPEPWRQLVFSGVVAVFLFGLMLYVLLVRKLLFGQVVYLTLILGGGLSNLIDRIAYDGRVIDFLNVGVGFLRTGIFNIADMAITAGAVLLAVGSFGRAPEKSAPRGGGCE